MAAAATLASGGQGSPPCTGYHFSLGLTPARARAKGFILWTPSLTPDEGLPSTRQDLAALDPQTER